MINPDCQKQLVKVRLKVAKLKQRLRFLQSTTKRKQRYRSELAQFLIDVNSA